MSLFYFLYPPDTKSLPFIKKMHYASDMTDMGKIRIMISEQRSLIKPTNLDSEQCQRAEIHDPSFSEKKHFA